MASVHEKLAKRLDWYRQWHSYEHHAHHHWLVTSLAFIFGIYVVFGAWQANLTI